jgi:predicted metal-dependent HD superfamily phosphohydrolase
VKERWQSLWKQAGIAEPPAGWYEQLMNAYAEPHRHYHTQQHIAECLTEFDEARHLIQQPIAVELALWFHDAVYDPKAADNEEQSALLFKRCAAEIPLPDSLIETGSKLVLATKHHSPDADCYSMLIVDIDLSIFGKPRERFLEYEQQIRQEYLWVPQALFSSKRAEILKRFLARETIYGTDWFRNKYEQQARRNLDESILKLRGNS